VHTYSLQLLRRNVMRFRGGLVFKAHRLLYHSTLGWRVLKNKKKNLLRGREDVVPHVLLRLAIPDIPARLRHQVMRLPLPLQVVRLPLPLLALALQLALLGVGVDSGCRV